jgi:hypothetical protein
LDSPDITWGTHKVFALAVFAAANALAAVLAAVPGGSVRARVLGVAFLIPAIYVLGKYDGDFLAPRWLSAGLPAALAVAGGLIASGLVAKARLLVRG